MKALWKSELAGEGDGGAEGGREEQAPVEVVSGGDEEGVDEREQNKVVD